MDCLTFRRLKLAVPLDASPEVIAHMQTCADCAAFTRQLEAFERELEEVANVAVPEGLAEQIILRHRRPQWFKRSSLALAATVVLSVAALVVFNVTESNNEMADTFVAHIVDEPGSMFANTAVEPAMLVQAFAGFGGQIVEPIGEARFVGKCRVGNVIATHMLVRTPYGDATVILMPEHGKATRRPLNREGYSVVVVPVPKGTVGIVTESAEQASKVESLITKRVRFHS